MAYATVMEFDVDLDTHLKIMDAVGDAPVEGLIVHTAGTSEAGVQCVDVWESKEQADRFFAEHLMPAMGNLGIAGGPPLRFEEFDLPIVIR